MKFHANDLMENIGCALKDPIMIFELYELPLSANCYSAAPGVLAEKGNKSFVKTFICRS